MPIARAMVREGKWGARKDSWPRVDTAFVEPIANAYYDWAADALPLGPLAKWAPVNRDDGALPSDYPTTGPLVVNSGGHKAVRFDGIKDRSRVATPDVPITRMVALVYRFVNYKMGESVFYGLNDSKGGVISTSTSIDTVSASSAGKWLIPNPYIPGDNNWHIAMVNVNNDQSAFRHDSKEAVGAFPTEQSEGITLGFGTIGPATGGTQRSNIEYRRVIILPPQGAVDRASLYAKLKEHYDM